MASQLTVSLELIAFMKWMLHHKKSFLNKLIIQALQEGLRTELAQLIEEEDNMPADELYYIVNSFLGHIEKQLQTQITQQPEQISQGALFQSFSPQTQVQLQTLDKEALSMSMYQTATLLDEDKKDHSEQMKKHLLLRQLLNNWSPPDSSEVN